MFPGGQQADFKLQSLRRFGRSSHALWGRLLLFLQSNALDLDDDDDDFDDHDDNHDNDNHDDYDNHDD